MPDTMLRDRASNGSGAAIRSADARSPPRYGEQPASNDAQSNAQMSLGAVRGEFLIIASLQ